MDYTSADFGVDSSSIYLFQAQSERDTDLYKLTDTSDHPNHATTTAGVGNFSDYATTSSRFKDDF